MKPQTIRNILHDANIRGRIPGKNRFGKKKWVKGLEFIKTYANKPLKF